MSITSIYEAGVYIRSVEHGDTLDDIVDYVSCHIDEWSKSPALWDMTLFNFQAIDQDSIRFFISKGKSLTKKRSGLKTAFLVDSDLGFGMMRMLQLIADEKVYVKFSVFRSKDKALQWLAEE